VNEAWIDPLGPVLVGSLGNFDVVNFTGKPVHDLELELLQVDSSQILGYYTGSKSWGLPPVLEGLATVAGTRVTWVDDRNPLAAGETRHFGLGLAPAAIQPIVRAYWTREVKVSQLPVPWQFWLVPPGNVLRDVVQLSDTFDGPATIRRDYALSADPVPLDQLNWALPASWQSDPAGPVTLRPGFQSSLDIAVDWTRWGSVLVRYEVTTATGETPVRFVNEAILGPGVASGLVFDSPVQIRWNQAPLQSADYDIVRGRIPTLLTLGGVQDATCLPGGDNLPAPIYVDAAVPDAGVGFYYLVRSELPGEAHGTYDSTTDPATREGRDAEIGPGDCP
jgi:hypothetical protein